MPAEPMTLLLRPRNFFARNPVLDVPPSYASTPSQLLAEGKGVYDASDKLSKLAFETPEGVDGKGVSGAGNGAGGEANGVKAGGSCCKSGGCQ